VYLYVYTAVVLRLTARFALLRLTVVEGLLYSVYTVCRARFACTRAHCPKWVLQPKKSAAQKIL